MRGGVYAAWKGRGTEDHDGRGHVAEERSEIGGCCEEDGEAEEVDEGGQKEEEIGEEGEQGKRGDVIAESCCCI